MNDPGSRRETGPGACFGVVHATVPGDGVFEQDLCGVKLPVGNASLRAFAPQICAVLIVQKGARIAR